MSPGVLGVASLRVRAGCCRDQGWSAVGVRVEVDGCRGEQAPWAAEELVLTPTGAWPEAVVGSGTPPSALHALYTDPRRLRQAKSRHLASVPCCHSTPTTTRSQPLLVGSASTSLGIPFHSDSHEDAGILDFSSLLKKR